MAKKTGNEKIYGFIANITKVNPFMSYTNCSAKLEKWPISAISVLGLSS